MSHEVPLPLYQDDPSVREVFANHTRLVHFDNGLFYVELTVARPAMIGENQAQVTQVPAARLVLTPQAVFGLHSTLSNLIASLEQNGALKRIAAPHATPQ